jgi:hypothetical protein
LVLGYLLWTIAQGYDWFCLFSASVKYINNFSTFILGHFWPFSMNCNPWFWWILGNLITNSCQKLGTAYNIVVYHGIIASKLEKVFRLFLAWSDKTLKIVNVFCVQWPTFDMCMHEINIWYPRMFMQSTAICKQRN